MSANDWIVLAGAFALGACLGSFLNVVAYRLPRGLNFVSARSACPNCGAAIRPADNVPLLSFAWLLGQCRWCSQPIGWRYPGMEIVLGLITTRIAWVHMVQPQPAVAAAAAALVCCGGLVVVAMIDLERRIIPDRISLPGIAVGLLASAAAPELHPALPGWTSFAMLDAVLDGAAGAAAGAGVLWLVARVAQWMAKEEAMGGGDVKLVAAMGAFLGLYGIALAAFTAVLFGAAIGLVVLVVTRNRFLPFGPFLALGAILVLLFPEAVVGAMRAWPAWFASLGGGGAA
ncbi:MAG: prepilin peptidase [Planctomycetota bacterium]|jgi:leader peptidase (prepilin peptidase)/N-methyltransferase